MSICKLGEIPYTSIEHVPALLAERRRDQSLIKKVISALNGDIPDYLLEQDCLVLSRHISTPNSEALYALEQSKKLGFMMIFSQDLDDKFTSVNNLKRRLAHPEICLCDEPSDRQFQKIALVDAPAAEGQRLRNVQTKDGRPLFEVHNELFDNFPPDQFRIVDESAWINRHFRGNIKEHYTRYLTLFVAHGVIIEDYEEEYDRFFKENIVLPTFQIIYENFGKFPILVRLHDETLDQFENPLAHNNKFLSNLSLSQ